MATMNPTRRTEGPASASLLAGADWVVGCSVRLVTTLDEVVEGTVFAYDRLSNCLTLTEEGSLPGTLDFRLLKTSCVKSILSARRPETPVDLTLPPLDLSPPTVDSESAPPSDAEGEVSEEEGEPERLNWEEEVEKEEQKEVQKFAHALQGVWGKPKPAAVVDPQPLPERSRREDPWGTKQSKPTETPKPVDPPTVSSYAAVSKGVERVSVAPSPAPAVAPVVSSVVPPVVQQTAPKGPWGVKNPRITSKVAYAQVASQTNPHPTPTSQPEAAKTGSSVGMVTMSLKTRTPMRN